MHTHLKTQHAINFLHVLSLICFLGDTGDSLSRASETPMRLNKDIDKESNQ